MFNSSMREKNVTNCPTEPIRWSLKAICREFSVSRVTIQRRMTEAKVFAGEDLLYSTYDVLIALTGGDYLAERLRKIKAEADHLELVNAQHRRDHLPKDEVTKSMEGTFYTMRNTILGSGIPEHLQDSLLGSLADITPPA
jgi:hypothetical protein